MPFETRSASDEEIIELLFRRDETGLVLVKRKYSGLCMGILKNMLLDPRDREECVQDALMSIWRHIPPDRPLSLSAYISRIVRNAALDRLKAEGRKRRVPKDSLACIDELSELLGSEPLESELERKRLKLVINGFAGGLDGRDRYIFIARYFCLDPIKDIAKAVGASESTVSKTLKRLRERLRKTLVKEELL